MRTLAAGTRASVLTAPVADGQPPSDRARLERMIELLRTTGAARRFTSTSAVGRPVVHQILDDARFAPSGGNRQPWRVAVVEDLARAPADRRR